MNTDVPGSPISALPVAVAVVPWVGHNNINTTLHTEGTSELRDEK